MANAVVIVGGSLAGLMHGLQLKRQGRDVVILEQDPAASRASHQAGIGFQTQVAEFLRRHDDTGVPIAVPILSNRIAWRSWWPHLADLKIGRQMSNWTLLYRVLRANFDAYQSVSCPTPPKPRDGDGKAEYRTGKRVQSLRFDEAREVVVVEFVDTATGEQESIDAGLVIGADGVHSTVRDLVQAEREYRYSGYVAWRGTVLESEVSAATREFFADRISLNLLSGRTYILCYLIPSDDGDVEPGRRLLNFIWYYNFRDDSEQMTQLMTDIEGRVRRNTVQQGFVRPSTWAHYRDLVTPLMIAPFAELLSKVKQPFVTKVNDCICASPSYYGGHVLLVGDAFCTIRPHLAAATEQAAYHSNTLQEVLDGKIMMEEWTRRVSLWGKKNLMMSVIMGKFGQGSTFSFLKSLVGYLWQVLTGQLR